MYIFIQVFFFLFIFCIFFSMLFVECSSNFEEIKNISIVSDGPCLTINVCGPVYCGPICGFLVFWLQIFIGPFALFHHSVFDYMCFSMMFHIQGIFQYIDLSYGPLPRLLKLYPCGHETSNPAFWGKKKLKKCHLLKPLPSVLSIN